MDLFKNKCRHELDTANLGSVDNDEIVKNKKQNIDMEKKALQAEAAMMVDPTREIKSKFKEVQGNLVGALNKEMKYESLVE